MGVILSLGQFAFGIASRIAAAALGKDELPVWPDEIAHHAQRLEMVARIPVERHAIDVIGEALLVHDLGRPVERAFLIVVPDQRLHVTEPGFAQRRFQAVVQELAFLLGAVQARLPFLHGLRMVMRPISIPAARYSRSVRAIMRAQSS